jgi:hypothetical protein
LDGRLDSRIELAEGINFLVPSALRRAFLLIVFVTSASGVALAQTVCDQLFPFGLLPPPEGSFGFGCANQYALRGDIGSAPGAHYITLSYPACENGPCAGLTGTSLFGCAATSGYSCCISVPEPIPIVGGNWEGPLRAALDQRIANDTDTRTGICYSDYAGNGSRLGNVPLIQFVGSDSSQVQVTGFLRMFVSSSRSGVIAPRIEFLDQATPVRSSTWGRTKVLYR